MSARLRAVLCRLLLLGCVSPAVAAQPSTPVGSRVTIGDFAIDATEVTVGQLRRVLQPGATRAERDGGGFEYDAGWRQRAGWVWHSPYGEPADDGEPAVHITWFEARDYCREMGGQLPMLEQWQLAAYTERRDKPTDGYVRGRRYEYPVGGTPEGMNTSGADRWPRHAPAGATRRGVNGLYDMGANVWEWLADADGQRALTAGGSWWYGAQKTRVQGAQYKPKDFAAVYIGFRCVYRPGNP